MRWPLCLGSLILLPTPASGSAHLLSQRVAALARDVGLPTAPVVTSASLPARPVKTLIWTFNGSFVATVLPASSSVNRSSLAAVLNASQSDLRLAPPDTATELTGFSPGSIPPLGFSRPLRVLLEAGLVEGGVVLAGGGGAVDHHVYVAVEDYLLLSGAQPTNLVTEERRQGGLGSEDLVVRLQRRPELRATPSVLRALATSSKSLAPVVTMLIAAGMDVDELGAHGMSALHLASSGGTLLNVRELLEAGASINRPAACEGPEDGFTPLMFATAAGRSSVVELLLDRGADPGHRSHQGHSALTLALAGGRLTHETLARLSAVSCPTSLDLDAALAEDRWNPLLTARTALWEAPQVGSVQVEMEGLLVSKRQVSRALLFGNIVPPGSPMPEHPLQWFVWRGLAPSGDHCAVQVIIGKTLRDSFGLDACAALCRKLRVGQFIRVRGRLQTSVEESNLDLIASEVEVITLPSHNSTIVRGNCGAQHLPVQESNACPSSAVKVTGNAVSSAEPVLDLSKVHRLCGHEPRLLLVDDLLSLQSFRAHFADKSGVHLIGLDCEWQPERERLERHKVSLLQLSDGHTSFIIDLQSLCDQQQMPGTPLSVVETLLDTVLSNLFRNEKTVVLGFSVTTDLTRLAASYPHLQCFREYSAVVDLFGQFKTLFPRGKAPSLSSVCRLSFGLGLDKTHQSSAWHLRPLAEVQLSYAAVDAAVLVALLQEWLRRPQWNQKRFTLAKVRISLLAGLYSIPSSSLRHKVMEFV